MTETRADVLAHRLSTRIDDLARALDRAGAPAVASARLLELAAVAAVHAVSLAELGSSQPEDAYPPPAPLALSLAA